MNNEIKNDAYNPIKFDSTLRNADVAIGDIKLENGKQNKIYQILNQTRIGRYFIQKFELETFQGTDSQVKPKLEALTVQLREVNQKIKDLKKEIKPEIKSLNGLLEANKKKLVDLQGNFDRLEEKKQAGKISPREMDKKIKLNEEIQELQAERKEYKEQRELLRKSEIQNLTDLRREWHQIKTNIKSLESQLEPTRFHRSSVIQNLKAAEQKVQNEFEDFASKFPGHNGYKAHNLEQKIAKSLRTIQVLDEWGTSSKETKLLDEAQKYLTKLYILDYKVAMSGDKETLSQIYQIYDRLEATFPDYSKIKGQAIDKSGEILLKKTNTDQQLSLIHI